MRAALALALALSAGARSLAAEPDKPEPPPVGITRHDLAGATRIDAVTPGTLLSYALPKGAGARREILMLVAPERPGTPSPAPEKQAAPEADPCREKEEPPAALPGHQRLLILLDLAAPGGGALRTLRDDLPADAARLDSMDLDGDGLEEILMGRPGELFVIPDRDGRRAGGDLRTLMRHPDLLPGKGEPPGLSEPRVALRPAAAGEPALWLDTLGGVRFYGPSDEGRSWDLRYEASVPMDAERRNGAFRLRSPRLRVAGRRPDGTLLFASGPEAYGRQRLRTLLIDPAAPSGSRPAECWSLLPGPEEVIESEYLLLDGRPALLVLTRSAVKLSLFEEKMLRLFLLDETDRSHTGTAPFFAAETEMNLWQRAHPVARDADGDGREDLILGYWKGLKDSRVVLDLYARRPDGSFPRSPSTTGFDVEKGDRSVLDFRADLDGDTRPDLLVVDHRAVMIYPGTGEGRGLVEKKPSVTVPFAGSGDFRGRQDDSGFEISIGGGGTRILAGLVEPRGPRPIDLDGDGRPEILAMRRDDRGRGLMQVILLAPGGGHAAR